MSCVLWSVQNFSPALFAGSYLGSENDSDFLIDWSAILCLRSYGIVLTKFSKNQHI